MRKILLLLLMAPLFSFAQKRHKGTQRQVFDLPRIDGKVTYMGKEVIKYNNFERSVKMALGRYVSYYNGLIMQESNKMKDYIVYEDSAVIVANVLFYVRQSLRYSLFSAEVTYKKLNDSEYGIKATDFKYDKISQIYTGQASAAVSLDNLPTYKNPRLYGMMQDEVKKLFESGGDD